MRIANGLVMLGCALIWGYSSYVVTFTPELPSRFDIGIGLFFATMISLIRSGEAFFGEPDER